MPDTVRDREAPGDSCAAAHDPKIAAVERLMQSGDSRAALVAAKLLHRDERSAATERLLVEAYARRVHSLRERGLATEAAQIEALVRTRFPRAARDLPGPPPHAATAARVLEDLVRPLAGGEAGAEGGGAEPASGRRAAIEAELRRTLADPSALARCTALAAEHPLRAAARALGETLAAVTSGPVAAEALALPEVSHRSPLAGYKLLIRAIAHFYRREDDAASRLLEAIDRETPPARLVAPLSAMIVRTAAPERGRAVRLVERVARTSETLRPALAAVDRALATGKTSAFVRAVQDAIRAIADARPDRVEWLKQHIAVRAERHGLDRATIRAALGGPPRRDATYWRLAALDQEHSGSDLLACVFWDQFRRQAVRAGWFGTDGPVTAAVYVRMTRLLARMRASQIDGAGDEDDDDDDDLRVQIPGLLARMHADQPAEIRAVAWDGGETAPPTLSGWCLDPGELYERAVQADPDPVTFRAWMAWARSSDRKGRLAERVASAWHQAIPRDPEPLLALMRSAERRRAYQKALRYLEAAEKLDALDSTVQRARFRLVMNTLIAQLSRRKPRLAARTLAELAVLPQSRVASRPAILVALGHALRQVEGDARSADATFQELAHLAGGDPAAAVMALSVARACRQPEPTVSSPSRLLAGLESTEILDSVARACAALADAGLAGRVPKAWEAVLVARCREHGRSSDPVSLLALASAAVASSLFELAYVASGTALATGGAHRPRCLVVRARSLPRHARERSRQIILAAATLARRSRDHATLGEAIDLLHDSGHHVESGVAMSDAEADQVVDQEIARTEVPDAPAAPATGHSERLIFCESCGALHPVDDVPDDDRDDARAEDEDEDEDDDDGGPDRVPGDATAAGSPRPPGRSPSDAGVPPELAADLEAMMSEMGMPPALARAIATIGRVPHPGEVQGTKSQVADEFAEFLRRLPSVLARVGPGLGRRRGRSRRRRI
jgi:hypothetical protein